MGAERIFALNRRHFIAVKLAQLVHDITRLAANLRLARCGGAARRTNPNETVAPESDFHVVRLSGDAVVKLVHLKPVKMLRQCLTCWPAHWSTSSMVIFEH